MGETFYTILEISPDADESAVRRAYREAVKDCHPDVSDDPDAGERFKRLTTARDVLVDADERKRYDRLGHDSYVTQHVDTSVWKSTPTADATERSAGSTANRRRGRTRSGRGAGEANSDHWSNTWSTGENSRSRTQTGAESRTQQTQTNHRWNSRRHSRADGGYDRPWQRAPDAYKPTETTRRVDSRTSVLDAVRAIGPWLFIHLVLITSALATSGFMLGRVDADPAGTVATGLFSVLLVAVVLLLSFLHILTEVS